MNGPSIEGAYLFLVLILAVNWWHHVVLNAASITLICNQYFITISKVRAQGCNCLETNLFFNLFIIWNKLFDHSKLAVSFLVKAKALWLVYGVWEKVTRWGTIHQSNGLPILWKIIDNMGGGVCTWLHSYTISHLPCSSNQFMICIFKLIFPSSFSSQLYMKCSKLWYSKWKKFVSLYPLWQSKTP